MDEPTWVPPVMVMAAHHAQLQEHGGSFRTRDDNAIEAALARPRNTHAYQPETDIADLAAAYLFGLATLHGYVDGNKRTALAVSLVFLELNGYDLDRSDTEVEETVIAVATHVTSEAVLAEWIRQALVALPPPEGATQSAARA